MTQRLGYLGFGIILTILSAGCSLKATLVPVEGPLSALRPVPVLTVKADGIMGSAGNLSFEMPGRDACRGRWASAAGSNLTFGGATLMTQYGSTHLAGYSLSSGSGQNPGAALATCASGRTFQLDFVTGAGTAHGFGIGKDNEGNVYRFVF